MGKIRELTHEEVNRLREIVLNRFQRSFPNGNGFKATTFKGAYEDIREDINKVVPGFEASVSLTRLRKLFYYTNADLCPADKLEKPSFGKDFILVLEKYGGIPNKVSVEISLDHRTPLRISKRVWFLVSLFLISGSMAWYFFLKKGGETKSWREDFNSTSVDSLRAHGFEWIDFDSHWWSKQLKDSMLTLWTLPGDYWVKKELGEGPMIKNMLIKKINLNPCVITSCIRDFNPYQNFQQAGLFLFGPNIEKDNSFRATMEYAKFNKKDIPYIDKWTDERQAITLYTMKNGKAFDNNCLFLRLPEFEPKPVGTLGIVIEIRGTEVTIYFWKDEPWRAIDHEKRIVFLPFFPNYVGLGAFQGFTKDNGEPIGADTIPSFFDYIEVLPLTK